MLEWEHVVIPKACRCSSATSSAIRPFRKNAVRTRRAGVPVDDRDPSSAHDYMNDPEVGPILLRVHSILARVADGHANGDAPARTG